MNEPKGRLIVTVMVAAITLGAFLWTPLHSQSAVTLSTTDVRASQESTAEVTVQSGQTKAAEQKGTPEYNQSELYLKTYELKYISVTEFMKSAKFYVVEYTGTESTMTVRIPGRNIPEFEALLKKLDVEKKNIQFQIITIIASKEAPDERMKSIFVTDTPGIADKDLRRVLDEMKGLWNFKYYRVDTPSFLIVRDGAGQSHFKLVSDRYDFDMNILHVNLRGDEPGKRMISVGQIQLNQSLNTPNGQERSTLLDTSDITFKENGYLVVGVSGFHAGWSGLALILVIRAEIR
jgi:hypothetical protein